ncbi:MAG: glycosyltransferase family 4 protein [bacterium]|jgi:glycosyltransferase involved in cell wall biosynthesis|nr:glycosyltransferase family 4 protein [bacterium]
MRIAMIGQKGFDVGQRGGGIERHVTELAERLVVAGEEVIVYAREPYSGGTMQGLDIRVVPTVERKHVATIFHVFLCTLDALRRKVDVFHYHGVGPATLSWIPRLLRPRSSVVVTFHSQDRYHKKWGLFARWYLLFGEWAAVWFPHVTIAVSHVIQVHARQKLKRQIVYIPNGAEVKQVEGSDELTQFGLQEKQYLLSVSRLVPHKGQHLLIQAFRQLQEEPSDLVGGLELVIVGAESYGADYQAYLSRLADGDPKIKFLGFQGGATLEQLFAHALLFVHPSEAEGLPVVVIEAMSYGLPLLVSDIPENLEVLHNAGFTFESASVADLQKMLRLLLQHPEQIARVQGETREVVETYFSWDVIAEEVLNLYRSIRH